MEERSSDVGLAFSRKEYRQRLDRVRANMADQGIDVLLVTSPASLNYVTGYDTASHYAAQYLILVGDGRVLMVVRALDQPAIEETTWLCSDRIRAYGEDYVDSYGFSSTRRHPVDFLLQVLRGEGLTKVRFGLEMNDHYCTATDFTLLSAALPDCSFKDTTQLIPRLFLIKSPAEIEYMREAAALAEHGMRTAINAVRVGAREFEVAAEVLATLVGLGGSPPSAFPMFQTTSACHVPWTDRRITSGTAVAIELAGCRRRYHCPMCRTVILSGNDARTQEAAKASASAQVAGLEEILATIRPGIKAEDVAFKADEINPGHSSRVGYAVGLAFAPKWGEHTASFKRGDQTVLQPNMTFHAIQTLTTPFMVETVSYTHLTLPTN